MTLIGQIRLHDGKVHQQQGSHLALARRMKPFSIDGVLLSDHLHCICTMPPDDTDFPSCWSIIKSIL